MNDISHTMRLSAQKVRKILITCGEYENNVSQKVIELYERGVCGAEICRKLRLSRSAVYGYLPYERAIYNVEDCSENAIILRKWRKRHQDS